MPTIVNISHGCASGGGTAYVRDGAVLPGGLIPVQAKASSSCCGATLAEGGTDEKGHTCTACGKPATKVMGAKTAHWTCPCGQRRSQVITDPQDGG